MQLRLAFERKTERINACIDFSVALVAVVCHVSHENSSEREDIERISAFDREGGESFDSTDVFEQWADGFLEKCQFQDNLCRITDLAAVHEMRPVSADSCRVISFSFKSFFLKEEIPERPHRILLSTIHKSLH